MEKIDYFSTVPDPRVKGRCKHKLSDILIIAIATYLCGGDDYASMYEFCKHRGELLKPLVELPNGCPSVDTIERVISRIDPTAFAECLSVFGNTLVDDLKGKLVSIDGKRIRGSKSSNSCPTYFQHGSMNTPSALRVKRWKRRAMKSPPSPMCLTALISREPW